MKNHKSVIQQKPDNILNMVQSDDPYVGIDHERDERFGETQCPSDNPSMCGYDPSKFFFFRLLSINHSECESGQTTCEAEILKEDCTCDCNHEPPPVCQVDFASKISKRLRETNLI